MRGSMRNPLDKGREGYIGKKGEKLAPEIVVRALAEEGEKEPFILTLIPSVKCIPQRVGLEYDDITVVSVSIYADSTWRSPLFYLFVP